MSGKVTIYTENTAAPQLASVSDSRLLLHELQVHQVELEMQNEELRRAQFDLSKNRNELHAIYDCTPFMMCVLGPDYRVVSANRIFSTITGWTDIAKKQPGIFGNLLRCMQAVSSPDGCGSGPICASCALRQALVDTFNGCMVDGVEHRTSVVRNGEQAEYVFLCSTARIENADEVRILLSLQDITERKQAENDRRSMARCLLDIEEKLKKRLAAEIHDEIGRDLTALGLNMAMISENRTGGRNDNLQMLMDDSSKLISSISRSARNIMGSLRPPGLDDLGLIASLRHHADLFTRRTGIAVVLEMDNDFPQFDAEREMVLFRIVQESLTNIAKHAAAGCVRIVLQNTDGLIRLSITDNGKGFDQALQPAVQAGSSLGLKIMRERAEMIGGTFMIDSYPGSGATVSVQFKDFSRGD